MKKFILVLLAALAACMSFFALPVSADEGARYARVTEEGVYFYSAADESAGLFILPRTYFVRIVGEAGAFYRVGYLDDAADGGALEGYCLADEVTPVDYIPETPYLEYSVTVTYSAGGDGQMPDSPLAEYEVSAAYYGEFAYGSATCYYVNIGGKFGYVPASACSAVSYPENPEHSETETPPEENAQPSGGFGALNVVLICVLAVAALGAIWFLFRPAKQRKNDEEEAEDVF